MIADLPRVEYLPDKDKITKKDVDDAIERGKVMDVRRKKIGGIGANLSNQINANSFIKGKMKSVHV